MSAAPKVSPPYADDDADLSVGPYRVVASIGVGGMAEVYLVTPDGPQAFQTFLVAKTVRSEYADDPSYIEMFWHEARLAARLAHPNVVRTFDVFEDRGRPVIVMEYLQGQSFASLLRRMPSAIMTLPNQVRILADVLEALAYAHDVEDDKGRRLNVVHRDVSPQNVMVTYEGLTKLLDFGIAKSSASLQVTTAGVIKGKFGYMAPEQANGNTIDHRADIFAVGVMLWEVLCKRRIGHGLALSEQLFRRSNRGIEPNVLSINPAADKHLARACAKAMAFDPSDRYQSSHAFYSDLFSWLYENPPMVRAEWAASIGEVFAKERQRVRATIEERKGVANDASLIPCAHEVPMAEGPNAASRLAPPLPPSSVSAITSWFPGGVRGFIVVPLLLATCWLLGAFVGTSWPSSAVSQARTPRRSAGMTSPGPPPAIAPEPTHAPQTGVETEPSRAPASSTTTPPRLRDSGDTEANDAP